MFKVEKVWFWLVVRLFVGYIGLDRYLLPLLGTPWTQPKPATATLKPGRTPATAH